MRAGARNEILVEIGTEELPPATLIRLAEAFREALVRGLDDARLAHAEARRFATPRRLAVVVDAVAETQPDETVSRRGPAVAAAFDSAGEPTKAALGFARSCGVDVGELGREETEKGAWLSYRREVHGQTAAALLPGLIERALAELPIAKRMRWGAGDAEFVRPVHWVCALIGDQVPKGRVLGIEIGSETWGHRFHHPQSIQLSEPSLYADRLRQAHVEPDFEARRASIRGQVEQLAQSAKGQADIGAALLDEVTALCEWPVALLGQFDAAFLEVPPEVLVETMEKNQKYFPVRDEHGALLPCFIAVSNIESRDPAVVRAGNERVIRPRFADAKFFWEQDLKTPLDARVDALDSIVFQHQLGSVRAKSERVARLSGWIASQLGQDSAAAERAAWLAKCDLVSYMVGEFAGLQGVMGRYYAVRAGEAAGVAAAMEEHYWPRFAGDRLPSGDCARAVALADRLDTLVGIFAIGQRPSGVKDPYGLRRAAIAVLRILIETPLALSLLELLRVAASGYRDDIGADRAVAEVFDYCIERLRGYYADSESDHQADADVVGAVISLGLTVPSDIDRRIRAVQRFRGRPEAVSLAAANKRTRNILKKAAPAEIGDAIQAGLLQDPSERDLALHLENLRGSLAPMLAAQDYDAALGRLAGMRDEVDRFFEHVLVMADDPSLRANRLAILRALEQSFLGVADISLLQPHAQ